MAALTQFADRVCHVTMSGKLFSGSDIWQTGFYVGKAEGPADAPTQAYADAVRDAWLTFFNDGAIAISNTVAFDEVKVARLDLLGKYTSDDVVVSHPAVATNGPGAGTPLPPQIALVATLIAGSGKGLAGKGRMFLPGMKFGVDGTGHIGAADAKRVADGLAVFFNTVGAIAGAPGVPINASRGHKLSLGVGARNVPINGVRVGNVYDTQRRRRNALTETYQVSGLIGA
jgi:hypothetical protein